MSNPFAGNFLWVLDPATCGGPEKVVEAAQATGYGLIVKYHDGDPSDDTKWNWIPAFRQIALLAQRAKVPVLSWGYCYGNKYGNLKKEADAAIASLDDGALGYVIDAESEWEHGQGTQWAKEFMGILKQKAPTGAFAYSTFWNLRWHPMFPAQAFVDGGCVAALPQVYFHLGDRWSPLKQREMMEVARQDFGGLPVYPVGEMTSGLRPGDVLNFLTLTRGAPHSLWLLDRVPPEHLRVLTIDRHISTLTAIREALRKSGW